MNSTTSRIDDAARAGWLYYVAGRTQDQIARQLGVSRQSAQRLVSLAVSEGLVKVRIDHPIARCLQLASELKARFDLRQVDVVPSDPLSPSSTVGVADSAAAEIERRLSSSDPIVMAIGTGRTLKAAIEKLPRMECPHHKVVSLTGNIAPDGSAAFYNVIFTMADKVKSRSFPMPLPVIASSAEERRMLHRQPMIQATLKLAAEADVTFVGVGDLGPQAPLFLDGFINVEELEQLRSAGAVAEIVGWPFDKDGQPVKGALRDRVASSPIPPRERTTVIGIAKGPLKRPGAAAALKAGLINALITDEDTAQALLLEKS